MGKLKFVLISLIVLTFMILSCEEKESSTGPEEVCKVFGFVFQEHNSFTEFIADATVRVGDSSATTDADGKYSLFVRPGEYTITCTHPNYTAFQATAVRIEADRSFDIDMDGPTYTVSGEVSHPTNGLVSGARVILDQLEVISDDTGYYAFTEIPRGPKTIQCIAINYQTFTQEIDVAGQDVIFDIVLTQEAYNYFGRVFHLDDGNIDSVIVYLDGTDRYKRTNADGEFLFENVAPGEHTVTFVDHDYDDNIPFPGYDTLITTINVVDADVYEEYRMTRFGVYTYLLEEDAFIAYRADSNVADSNYGLDTFLNIVDTCFIDTTIVEPDTTIDTLCRYSRVLAKIPEVFDSVIVIDSVFLRLMPVSIPVGCNDCDFVYHYIEEDWSEATVTWNNQPLVTSEYRLSQTYPFPPTDTTWRYLNISDYFLEKDPALLYGVRVRFESEADIEAPFVMKFGSREIETEANKPFVAVFGTK